MFRSWNQNYSNNHNNHQGHRSQTRQFPNSNRFRNPSSLFTEDMLIDPWKHLIDEMVRYDVLDPSESQKDFSCLPCSACNESPL